MIFTGAKRKQYLFQLPTGIGAGGCAVDMHAFCAQIVYTHGVLMQMAFELRPPAIVTEMA